jgi:hypothetical protein
MLIALKSCLYSYICLFFLQANWDDYGIDFDRPVNIDDDETTVTVNEIENLLSQTQRDELKDKIDNVSNDCFSQLEMISKFSIAKMYIYNACEQN